MQRLLAAVLVASTVAADSASTVDRQADDFIGYEDLQALLPAWEAAGATITVPATSNAGRDLTLVSVGHGPVDLLITARLHANEPSGTEAAVRLVSLLLGDPAPTLDQARWAGLTREAPLARAFLDDRLRTEVLQRVTLHVLPMLDPDGVESGNQRDFMANSDYATRATPQASAILETISAIHPALLVDLHGGPDQPLNIGLVEPRGIDDDVQTISRQAAAAVWRSAAALDVPVRFFEEHPLGLAAGLDGEPFDSADEAYYASLSRLAPVTWESLQLEGIPAVYTETVGLQSTAPEITVLEGASIQQATVLALMLDLAGLLDGTRPALHDVTSIAGSAGEQSVELELDEPAIDVRITVSWPWQAFGSDWSIHLVEARTGSPVASDTGNATEPARRSRMLRLDRLERGSYRIVLQPIGGAMVAGNATLQVLFWHRDDVPRELEGILATADDVALCLEGDSVYRQATRPAGLATESCPTPD